MDKKPLQPILEAVKAGKDVALICWCAPLACHGDVIKAWLEYHANPVIEVVAYRTHARTRRQRTVVVTLEYAPTLADPEGDRYVVVTRGGVTGHESLCPANAHPSWKPSSGWAACMGCTKYDRLFIPGPEMVRALKFFGVKDFDPK